MKRASDYLIGALAGAGLALSLAGAASAASVNVSLTQYTGNAAGIAQAKADQATFLGTNILRASEGFEGFAASPAADSGGAASNPTTNPLVTGVGTFRSIAPSVCGGSCIDASDLLQVRSGEVWGRFNTTSGGRNFLDSNDNSGMEWEISAASGIGNFDRISFLLTDVDDVGKVSFNISTRGDVESATGIILNSRPANGTLSLVTMVFDHAISDLFVGLNIDKKDGFGIDDVQVSAVPLPAAGFLLLGGMAGLGAVSRLRRKESKEG